MIIKGFSKEKDKTKENHKNQENKKENKNENENRNVKENINKLKGFRIRTFSLWMVIGTIFVSALIGKGMVDVMKRHHALSEMTREYLMIQDDVMKMSLGSNYLTEQARLYAVTKEYQYVADYMLETKVTQRREHAVKEIEEHLQGQDEEALKLSKSAMELSNALMDLEIHSMKLAALSQNADLSAFPKSIREYELTDEELQYTRRQMDEAASELIFGAEYQNMKRQIEEKLASVTKSVIEVCERKQAESEAAMKNALVREIFYTILVVALVVLSYILIALLILRPIRIYVNCINNKNYLEIIGAYEFKYFAVTYNNVYEMSLAQQNLLREKAERDALTGLLNRQAFEQLKEKLQDTEVPVVLLLIDIDVFKSINDTYGHEIGDQALQKAAGLLEESFRTSDYVLRIGGDEFAVVMENIKADKKKIISDKIDRINRQLLNPNGDFPKYSISAGIAFSENGYQDELFRQADHALYHTKENGRCGYAFYEENTASVWNAVRMDAGVQ